MQKRICRECGGNAKKNYVTIKIDDKSFFICDTCMAKNREAMLADENHPAWQYFNVIAAALGYTGKTKTDD